jgi:hypothetical protein
MQVAYIVETHIKGRFIIDFFSIAPIQVGVNGAVFTSENNSQNIEWKEKFA